MARGHKEASVPRHRYVTTHEAAGDLTRVMMTQVPVPERGDADEYDQVWSVRIYVRMDVIADILEVRMR